MLKTIRRYYWLTQKFAARHYKVVLKTVGLVTLLSAAFIFISRYIPAARKVTRIGMVGKYTPETMPTSIQRMVSSGLVTLSETGEAKPALATKWAISEDGRKYTFTLNSELKWHDGSTLTPQDIAYNFKEVKTELGTNTITYELPEPFAPFLQAISRPILKNGTLGTGTLQIQKTKVFSGVLQQIILLSEHEKLVYKFYPNESSAVTAFRLGEVDKLENVSMTPPELKDDPTIKVDANNATSRIVVLFMNNHDTVLTSKSTRQGLAYAIKDKAAGHTRALSPIDRSSWAYNPLVKEYEYDAERAKTLFFTDISKDTVPSLELKTTLTYLDLAEQIASDWRETLGVQVDVKVVTNIGNDYQALLTDFAPPIDPDQYTIWHSTQATNYTHYSNLKEKNCRRIFE